MKIVLASESPRRRRLFAKITRKFVIKPAFAAEKIHAGEAFPAAAIRLAEAKARAVARKEKNAVVVGADTIAFCGKKIYRKTSSKSTARKILLELSGKIHTVVTGIAVVFPDGKCVRYCVKAIVKMKKLDKKMLEAYLKSGEWKGRAGSYDVSGKGKKLVAGIKGEKETVIGLPLKRLKKLLAPYL